MSIRSRLFHAGSHSAAASLGLLILRGYAGLMLSAGHGWGKIVGFGERAAEFPDPLGIGHHASMACAAGAEFFCAALVVLGLATRITAIPPAFTMAVAALLVHADDPWGKKELALLFGFPFVVLVLTGAGRYSLDARLGGRKR